MDEKVELKKLPNGITTNRPVKVFAVSLALYHH